MPPHDFTLIKPNVFHAFHNAWNTQIMGALNNGILPAGYYALSEQVSGDTKPDVVTIDMLGTGRHHNSNARNECGTMVALPPPKTEIALHAEGVTYAKLRRTVTIRKEKSNAIVALIEVLSNANKASKIELDRFVDKVDAALGSDIHVLLIDVYPPNRLAPQGIHGKVWAALGQEPDRWPKNRPLTAASYEAGETVNAYIQPFAVGDPVPVMPLFLQRGFYVNIPMERAYLGALELMPKHYRDLLAHGKATKKGA